MATVRRYDRGEIRKAEKTPDGFLRAPAVIARAGIYLYVDSAGKITRELRRPEQVGDPESLASFSLSPVTDMHPPEGYVDATTANKYQRGSLGETVEFDGTLVHAPMMITSADLVKKVLDGDATECSCGYTCDVLEVPGEWNGQPYDTEQTKIRGNHVAIVSAGRAGPAARVKLDAGDAIAIPEQEALERAAREDTQNQENPMEREITINGIKVKLPSYVCDAIEAERTRSAAEFQAKIDMAAKCGRDGCSSAVKDGECVKCGKAKNDALQAATAKVDALTAEVATLKIKIDEVSKASPKIVVDALEVVDVARRAGVEVKVDALDLGALRRAVAEKVNGVSLEGKADAYVAAAFDLARAKVDDAPTGAVVREVVNQDKDGVRQDEESAETSRKRMEKRNADAWKPAEKK